MIFLVQDDGSSRTKIKIRQRSAGLAIRPLFLLLLRSVFPSTMQQRIYAEKFPDEWVLKYLTTHVDTEHTSH